MKKVFYISLLFFAVSLSAQDIKMKRGTITIDDKNWAMYEDCGMFDDMCTITKGDSEIVIKTNSINDPTMFSPNAKYTHVSWSEIKFIGTHMVFEVNDTYKGMIKTLYKGGVFDDEGKFNEEKISRLVEKYGNDFSNKYFKSSSPTVIINNNSTERSR